MTDNAKQELMEKIRRLSQFLQDNTGVNVLENMTSALQGVAVPIEQIGTLDMPDLEKLRDWLAAMVDQVHAVASSPNPDTIDWDKVIQDILDS